MRVGILIALGVSLLAAIACVPDFAFSNGTETSGGGRDDDGDGGDGDGGRKRPNGDGGDGGGRRPSTVGGLSTTDGQGPVSTASGSDTTSSASSSGEGGAGHGTPTATSSASVTTSASSGSGGTVGVPCWDGGADQVVTCQGGESACCADTDFYVYDECGSPGGCGEFAWELGCNESADCGAQLCCVTTDGDGGLASIGCSASCSEFEACDPSKGCTDGSTCTPIPQLQDDAHPEYDAYGYCN